MADLVIHEDDMARLRAIATRENRPVADVVSEMIAAYEEGTPDPYTPGERAILTRIYAEARDYWRRTGDNERLALTDDQLDEQFWCIDPDSIPRLKVDQATITLPEDGLSLMAQWAEEAGEYAKDNHVASRFDEAMTEAVREEMRRHNMDRHGE